MKDKKRSTIVAPLLFFVAVVFFALFILIQFREDYLAVVGVGIVTLIAAYFLVEKIEDTIHKNYELDKEEILLKFEEQSLILSERCERIEKILKAIYVTSVNEKEFLESKFSELKSDLDKIKVREVEKDKIS